MAQWLSNLFGRFSKRYTKTTLGHPQSLQYWIQKLFLGANGKTLSGMDVTEDTALTYGAFFRAVNILAGAVGFLPLKVYRREDRGKIEDFGHEHYLLQYRANPYMDAQRFRKLLQAHAVCWGNGYAEIERDGSGRAKNLWPLLPDRTVPKVIGTGSDQQLVYETRKGDATVQLDADDVIHIAGLGFDGLKGYSLVSYAAESLGLGLAAERYSAAFFGNEATPSGAIKIAAPLEQKSVKALKEAWEREHQALDKKHSIAVLHGGMEWQQIGISAKDAQLIESRKLSVADISRWTGIPLHMLSDLSEAHYTNIEHQAIDFVTWCLMDWLRPWEIQLTLKLLDGRGKRFAEFNLDGLLRGDTTQRHQAYHNAIQDGWMNRNEVRAKENMNPGPAELDVYLEPLNMVPAGTPREPSEGAVRKALDNRWVNSVDLIEQTWERIVTKETKSLKTHLGKADFAERAAQAYEKLETHIHAILWPVLRACLGANVREKVGGIVTRYLEQHQAALQTENPETLLKTWTETEPARLTREIVKGYYHATL